MKKTITITKKRKQFLLTIAAVAIVLIIVVGVVVRNLYDRALKPLNNSQNIVLIDVPSGSSVQEIGNLLKDKKVIRESWAFVRYVQNSEARDDLKAGTYALRPSQSVSEIVEILARGEVATDLVTIIPGQRIDQVQATMINSGFKPSEVKQALNPANYKNHPALVDKPANASLEGYLYPESFQKTSQTNPRDIIRASLDEMQKRLTPAVRNGIARRGLTLHEGIILASIVEAEVARPSDRPVVASVFLNRLHRGMHLQSDVTVLYGAIAAGKSPSLDYDSPYNTFTHKGLPKGPIGSLEKSALTAVVNPANSDYLYFVAGDDGKTYFAKTLEEHEQNVQKHCKTQC